MLDERCGQVPHERELLLAGAPQLPARLAMPHGLLRFLVVGCSRSGPARRCPPIEDPHAVAALLEPHPEVEPLALEQLRDLLKRLLAEVLDLQNLVLGL